MTKRTQSGTTPKPGNVVLVPFPFSDLRAVKQRPAMVVSEAEYNRSGRDVIVCAMTSNLQNSGHSVLVTGRDMAEGRLVADSRVKADKVATVERSIIRKTVGQVRPAVLERVRAELAHVLGLRMV